MVMKRASAYRHPGESRDSCLKLAAFGIMHIDRWIPAFAGMTE
jgi:hypothetical protein